MKDRKKLVAHLAVPGEGPCARPVFWRRAWARLLGTFNRRFRNWNDVYVFDLSLRRQFDPPTLRIERYGRVELIPDQIYRARCDAVGATAANSVERYIESIAVEMRHGATYWVGYLNDGVAGIVMSRSGIHFRRWFVPLNQEDLVLFSAETFPAFRGRGVHPAMLLYIIAQELRPGGRAYIDCKIYNSSAKRTYQKVGFRKIATKKPLSRNAILMGEH